MAISFRCPSSPQFLKLAIEKYNHLSKVSKLPTTLDFIELRTADMKGCSGGWPATKQRKKSEVYLVGRTDQCSEGFLNLYVGSVWVTEIIFFYMFHKVNERI